MTRFIPSGLPSAAAKEEDLDICDLHPWECLQGKRVGQEGGVINNGVARDVAEVADKIRRMDYKI